MVVIYYRDDFDWRQESDIAKKYFPVVPCRTAVKPGQLVIPRFSALPFYKELEMDVEYIGAKLINTYSQHRYIADLMNWYEDLKDYTPKTWEKVEYIPDEGPFVLKGETNSKKFLWKTHMFARDRMEAIDVFSRLSNDGLIGDQKIYVREYVPLKTYMVSIQDLPITKEFRVFCYNKEVLSIGYYWANHIEDLNDMGIMPDVNDIDMGFLGKVMDIVSSNVDFYVVDIAETASGEWVVIELNDGSMSGLSCNDPDELYSRLRVVLGG